MGQRIAEELEQLKKELAQKKGAVTSIRDLIKGEIDKDFTLDLWQLSPRELDSLMGERLSFLNDDIDTRPDRSAITSHRGILGKPIVIFKKIFMKLTGFYTNALMEKQRQFNAQLVAYHLSSFIRFRHIEQKLKEIEERIADTEDNQELLTGELRQLQEQLRKGKQG